MALRQEAPQEGPTILEALRRRTEERRKKREEDLSPETLLDSLRARRERRTPPPEPTREPISLPEPSPTYPGGAPSTGLLPEPERFSDILSREPRPEPPSRKPVGEPVTFPTPSPTYPGGAPSGLLPRKPPEEAPEAAVITPEPPRTAPGRVLRPEPEPEPTPTPEIALSPISARPPERPEPPPVMPLMKPGVVWENMSPSVLRQWDKVEAVAQEVLGSRPIVTSARKEDTETLGTPSQIHKAGSLHYQGEAFDLRTRGYSEEKVEAYRSKLQEVLGAGWDVLIEEDHIHVESQPEQLAQDPDPTRQPSAQERAEKPEKRQRFPTSFQPGVPRVPDVPLEEVAPYTATALEMAGAAFLPGKFGENYEQRVFEQAPPELLQYKEGQDALALMATIGRVARFPVEVLAFGPFSARATKMTVAAQSALMQRLMQRFPALMELPFIAPRTAGALRHALPGAVGGAAFGIGIEGMEAAGDIAAGEDPAEAVKHRVGELIDVLPGYAALGGGLGLFLGGVAASLAQRGKRPHVRSKAVGAPGVRGDPDVAAAYRILGLSETATEAQVKKAYRDLSKRHHPDGGGSSAEFVAVGDAYQTVMKARGGQRPPQAKREPPPRPAEPMSEASRRKATQERAQEIEVEAERIINEEADLVERVIAREGEDITPWELERQVEIERQLAEQMKPTFPEEPGEITERRLKASERAIERHRKKFEEEAGFLAPILEPPPSTLETPEGRLKRLGENWVARQIALNEHEAKLWERNTRALATLAPEQAEAIIEEFKGLQQPKTAHALTYILQGEGILDRQGNLVSEGWAPDASRIRERRKHRDWMERFTWGPRAKERGIQIGPPKPPEFEKPPMTIMPGQVTLPPRPKAAGSKSWEGETDNKVIKDYRRYLRSAQNIESSMLTGNIYATTGQQKRNQASRENAERELRERGIDPGTINAWEGVTKSDLTFGENKDLLGAMKTMAPEEVQRLFIETVWDLELRVDPERDRVNWEKIALLQGVGSLNGVDMSHETMEAMRQQMIREEAGEAEMWEGELEEKPKWEVSGEELGEVYHGGKTLIETVDPRRLQARDAGLYGEGFYVTTNPKWAKQYGPIVSTFRLKPDARVLMAAGPPSKAPEGLVDEILRYANEVWRPKAVARGKAHFFDEEIEDLKTNPIEWKKRVNRYAEETGYDAIFFFDSEIVIKNPNAIVTPKEKPVEVEPPPTMKKAAGELEQELGGEEIDEWAKELREKEAEIAAKKGKITFQKSDRGGYDITGYHGSYAKEGIAAAGQKFGGVHIGTERAAHQRLFDTRGSRGRGIPGGSVEQVSLNVQRPLGTPDEPITEDQLFHILNLPDKTGMERGGRIVHGINALREQGYDAIIYENSVEDPGSISVLILDQGRLAEAEPSEFITRDEFAELYQEQFAAELPEGFDLQMPLRGAVEQLGIHKIPDPSDAAPTVIGYYLEELKWEFAAAKKHYPSGKPVRATKKKTVEDILEEFRVNASRARSAKEETLQEVEAIFGREFAESVEFNARQAGQDEYGVTPEAPAKEPKKRMLSAKEKGAEAFRQGKGRVVPTGRFSKKTAEKWLEGWDQASKEAPRESGYYPIEKGKKGVPAPAGDRLTPTVMAERFPVPCPRSYCGAAIGEPCRSSRGNLTTFHIPRLDAARKIGKEIDDLNYDEQVEWLKRERGEVETPPAQQGLFGEPAPEPKKKDVEIPEPETETDLWGVERPVGPEQPELFKEKETGALSESEELARATVSSLEGKVQRGEASPQEVQLYDQAKRLLDREKAISEEEIKRRAPGEEGRDEMVIDLDLEKGQPAVLVGHTRSKELIGRLQELGWGRIEITAEAERMTEWEDYGSIELRTYEGEPWAVDSGIYAEVVKNKWPDRPHDFFGHWLRRIETLAHAREEAKPFMVVLPDRPNLTGDPRITPESLDYSRFYLQQAPEGLRYYLPLQDGMTEAQVGDFIRNHGGPKLRGLFLGGSDKFKATEAQKWADLARRFGLDFHYARAGTVGKLEHAIQVGATSIDSAFPLWTKERFEEFVQTWQGKHPQTKLLLSEGPAPASDAEVGEAMDDMDPFPKNIKGDLVMPPPRAPEKIPPKKVQAVPKLPKGVVGDLRIPSLEEGIDMDPPFEALPADLPDGSTLHPINPVELTRLLHTLLGEERIFTSKDPRFWGAFYPMPDMEISGKKFVGKKIKLNILLGKDYEQFRRTLAHEGGHLIDFLDEQTMARGNILGRLASLKRYMMSTLDKVPTDPSRVITKEERAEIRKAAEKWAGPKPDSKKKKAEYELWKGQVQTFYNERIQELVEQRNLLTKEKALEETKAVSAWWRPWDEKTAGANLKKYRNSSEEIYADVLSVFLNSPGSLQERAPTWFDSFLAYMENKPEVKAEYDAIQELIGGSAEQRYGARVEELDADFDRGEEILKQAEEERQKPHTLSPYERAIQTFFQRSGPSVRAESRRLGKGVEPWHEDRVFKLAEQEFRHGYNANHMIIEDVAREVYLPLEEAGVSQKEAGRYMMQKRIAFGDRGGFQEKAQQAIKEITGEDSWPKAKRRYIEIGNEELGQQLEEPVFDPHLLAQAESGVLNPRGYTPKESEEMLEMQETDLGAGKWEVLIQAVDKSLRPILQRPIFEAVKVGIIDEATFKKKIEPNLDYYAAYAVLDYWNGTMPAGIIKQTGTVKGVANPMTTSVLKALKLQRVVEYQKVATALVETAVKDFPDSVGEEKPINRFRPEKKARHGYANLRYWRNGRLYYREMEDWLVKQIGDSDIGSLTWLAEALSSNTYKILHPLYVAWSLSWQARNVPRDALRTWVDLSMIHPGNPLHQILQSALDIGRMAKAYKTQSKSAWAHARRRYDPVIRQMMKDRALGRAFHSFDPHDESEYLVRMMERAGILKPAHKGTKGVLQTAGRPIEIMGVFQETLAKAAAFKILGDLGITGRQRAYFVRNQTGTPDSSQQGLAAVATNGLWLYSNVIFSGLRADWEAATNPKTAFGWWFRTVVALSPKLAMLALAGGAFGIGLKQWFDAIPSYDKEKYVIVPIPGLPMWVETPTGERKAVYARIPHMDTHRVLAGLVWMLGTRARPESFQSAMRMASGEFPGVNPLMDMGLKWYQYFTGQNPYDTFLDRNVVPQTEWTAGGWAATKEMLRWTANEFGVVSQLAGYWTYGAPRETTAPGEKLIRSTPGLSALVKYSNRGMYELRNEEVEHDRKLRAKLKADLTERVRYATGRRYQLNEWGVMLLDPRERAERVQYNTWYARYYLPYTERMELARDAGQKERYNELAEALDKSVDMIGKIPVGALRQTPQPSPPRPPRPPTRR